MCRTPAAACYGAVVASLRRWWQRESRPGRRGLWLIHFDHHSSHWANSLRSGKSPSFIGKSFTGWWFGTFFIFPYIGNHHPNWLIFFRGVAQPPTSLFLWAIFNSYVSFPEGNHWVKSGKVQKSSSQILLSGEFQGISFLFLFGGYYVYSSEVFGFDVFFFSGHRFDGCCWGCELKHLPNTSELVSWAWFCACELAWIIA